MTVTTAAGQHIATGKHYLCTHKTDADWKKCRAYTTPNWAT